MAKREITTEDMYSKLEPFSSYHASLLFFISFIGVFCGQLMSFNVFGHYEPGKRSNHVFKRGKSNRRSSFYLYLTLFHHLCGVGGGVEWCILTLEFTCNDQVNITTTDEPCLIGCRDFTFASEVMNRTIGKILW